MLPDEELQTLSDAWNKAEEYLKIAEQISSEALQPGINELRYAGRKVIEALALTERDQSRIRDLLRDARMDCQRAQHDAIDASISIISENVNVLLDRVGITNTQAALPDVGKMIALIATTQERIAASRQDRNNRVDIYDSIKEVELPELKKLYDQLRACEPQLLREAEVAQAKERQHVAFNWVNLAFAASGLVVGIISVLVALVAF